jgi:hypothetical protein
MDTEPSKTGDAASGIRKDESAAAGPGWYSLLFGPPFKLIGFFYRSYQSNRKRLAQFLSSPRVSSLIRYALVLTLFLWISIWLLASEESRNRLTETARQHFRSLSTTFGE